MRVAPRDGAAHRPGAAGSLPTGENEMAGGFETQSAEALSTSGGEVGARMMPEDEYAGADPVTGWAGWAAFAGVIMVMAGAFQAAAGLVALLNDDVYLVSTDHLSITMSYTAWG